jgi:hypothetical protein
LEAPGEPVAIGACRWIAEFFPYAQFSRPTRKILRMNLSQGAHCSNVQSVWRYCLCRNEIG